MCVQLWLANPLQVDQKELQSQIPILSELERSRYAAFRFETHRHHYLAAHLLLRRAISHYASIPLSEVRWNALPHQKPFCENTLASKNIEFSLTHTHGFVACAVSQVPVGIDAEWVGRKISPAFAQSVLSDQEFQRWQNVDANKQNQEFFHYWTLKEAYVKGIGKGIAFPFRKLQLQWDAYFDVSLAILKSDTSSDLSCIEYVHDWRLGVMPCPSAQHVVAFAIRKEGFRFEDCKPIVIDLRTGEPKADDFTWSLPCFE